MHRDNETRPHTPRPLEDIFKAHLENSLACSQVLGQLLMKLEVPESYVTQIKHMAEKGDRLTAEAYEALELLPDSETVQLTEQFVKRLDDIVDGMNVTARIIDVFMPTKLEDAAEKITALISSMVSRLLAEVQQYPFEELTSVRQCREALKIWEENADIVYHEWRKSHRRHGHLSLRAETDWTELLGILEHTTDSCYHAALLLKRMAKHHLRQQSGSGDSLLARS